MAAQMTIPERVYALLRWSERYTKTDMVYLASGGFWLSVGTAVTAFSSFILSIAFANLLPPAVYGSYKYVISAAAIFSAFTLTGLEVAITHAVSRGYEGILRRGFITNLLWSIPSSAIALGVGTYYFLQGNNILGAAFFLIAIAQPLTASTNFGAAFLNGKKQFRSLAVFYSIDNLVPALALIGTMFFAKDALSIIFVYFIANLLTTAGMYWYVLTRFKPNNAVDPESIRYGKHLSAMSIISNVADNFDKILTFHFLGAAELAIYSFALALPSQTKLITKPLFNLIFPRFAERPVHEIRGSMGEKMLRFFIAGLFMAVVYIALAPLVFKIFYPKYTDAVFLSQIFAISLLATTGAPAGIFLSAKRKVRSQYISNIFISIFQISSAVVGIFFGGLMGLVLARLSTRIMGAILSIFFFYTDKSNE